MSGTRKRAASARGWRVGTLVLAATLALAGCAATGAPSNYATKTPDAGTAGAPATPPDLTHPTLPRVALPTTSDSSLVPYTVETSSPESATVTLSVTEGAFHPLTGIYLDETASTVTIGVVCENTGGAGGEENHIVAHVTVQLAAPLGTRSITAAAQ